MAAAALPTATAQLLCSPLPVAAEAPVLPVAAEAPEAPVAAAEPEAEDTTVTLEPDEPAEDTAAMDPCEEAALLQLMEGDSAADDPQQSPRTDHAVWQHWDTWDQSGKKSASAAAPLMMPPKRDGPYTPLIDVEKEDEARRRAGMEGCPEAPDATPPSARAEVWEWAEAGRLLQEKEDALKARLRAARFAPPPEAKPTPVDNSPPNMQPPPPQAKPMPAVPGPVENSPRNMVDSIVVSRRGVWLGTTIGQGTHATGVPPEFLADRLGNFPVLPAPESGFSEWSTQAFPPINWREQLEAFTNLKRQGSACT